MSSDALTMPATLLANRPGSRPRPDERTGSPRRSLPESEEIIHERHAYAAAPQCRIVGVLGTCTIYTLVLLAALVLSVSTVTQVHRASSALTVVSLDPDTPAEDTPPAKPVEVPPGPAQHEQQAQTKAAPRQKEAPQALDLPVAPVLLSAIPAPVQGGPSAERNADAPAADARQVDRTTAPPAPSGGSKAKAEWADVLITYLKTFRRYPRRAESMRQQGVVHLELTIDRGGRLLKASILKGSGYPLLDSEALATVRRASPLPAPTPDVRGDPVTVDIPIQFSLR